ncbi:MAG TPA: NAD-dependent epimerase/dehydratase family protein, partial [Candidatus Hydrogenedentes bacterium]|nr:NAD-dependent epimerase/dehydratase family protein [Candidatus Hydrogenedentota bacterium]
MNILVTGGAGYVGCHLAPMLAEQGHRVRVFDRMYFGHAAEERFKRLPHCEVIQGDIRKLRDYPRLLDDIEAIIHLAGLSNDPSCDLDAEMAMDVNVEGTRDLVGRALVQGVRRFVLASSCSVYGKGVIGLLDEESPTNPVSTYARGKLMCEQFLLPLSSERFEPVVARPATLFGWSDRMRFDLAINQMAATAVRKRLIRVYGGGEQWRPFLHVRDVARAFALLVQAPAEKVAGEVFNVGSDDANYQIRALADLVGSMFPGSTIEDVVSDEDLRNYNVQFNKILRVLGYTHEHSVEEGVREIRDGLQRTGVDPFDDIYFNVRWMKHLLAMPVEQGGEPSAPRFIGLSPPNIGAEEERAVEDVLRSGWLTTGAKVQEFEKAFA